MSRLPVPGSDTGSWGEILNDYLLQSHNNSGLLKDSSVTGSMLAPGAVTKSTIGLANVDNTADTQKPISTAVQAALDAKLAATNNLSDLAAPATARTNLGLGSAATMTPAQIAANTALSSTYATRAAAKVSPPLAQIWPQPMASPPTMTLSAQQTASPISSPLNTIANFMQAGLEGYHVNRRNGTYGVLTANSNSYDQNQMAAGEPSVQASAKEFDFYGTEFAIKFRCGVASLSSLWIWIDGVPATAAPVPQAGATVVNFPYWLTVTFADAGPRRVKIWAFTTELGDISYVAGNFASPVATRQESIVMYGDSWIGGALSVPDHQLQAYLIPHLLGMEGFKAGQGSTGFTTAGTGPPKANYLDTARIAKVLLVQPKYLYVHISQNDDGAGASSSETMRAAVASFCSSILTGSPSTKIIIMGPPRLNTTLGTGSTNNLAGALTAATAASNVIGLIDNNSDTIYGRAGSVLQAASGTSWLTGTGRIGAPVSNGTNCDVFFGSDAAHLTVAGHRYWAQRAAAACRIIIDAA